MTKVNGPNGRRRFQLVRAYTLLTLGVGLILWDVVFYGPGTVDPIVLPLYVGLCGLGGIEFFRSS